MNWKDEAVEKLRRYPVMCHCLQAIPREIALLAEESQSLQTGMAASGGGRNVRSRENRLLDNLVRRQELENQLRSAKGWVENTAGALALLEPMEQKVLRLLYMDGIDATEVCRELGVERSSLYRYRDTALRKLTLALYGAVES